MKPEEQNHVIYDIEVYKNVFTCVVYSAEYDEHLVYEVSERQNDFVGFIEMLEVLGDNNTKMVGFNNLGYDYPVIHHLMKLGRQNPKADWKEVTKAARWKSDEIINGSFHDRFKHTIWPNDQFVQQIDLYKIHHFDNANRQTSLKAIEFARRSKDVGDLPFDVHHLLKPDEIDELLRYNKHDVDETYEFYLASLEMLDFRDHMGSVIGKDVTNHNDGKIGKELFIKELEDELGKDACFYYEDGSRHIRQTKRGRIPLGDVIFPYVEFEKTPFQEVVKWIRNKVITDTKGELTEIDPNSLGALALYCNIKKKKGKIKNLNCIYKGIQFDFGTGGLHACIEAGTYESDDEFTIIDLDVTSYYPSLAIENEVFPAHLNVIFCHIYQRLKTKRMSYDKGTMENLALKLALNVVYGDSNNQYSPFFDPQYTMTITVNGQLLLCLLSEWVMDIEGLQFLQANTDGITVRIPRDKVEELNVIRSKWEEVTKLELEEKTYSRMWIRKCNHYIAEYEGGGLKRKGDYCSVTVLENPKSFDVGWHQNHSQLVVAKAAEAHLVNGADIEEFILNHDDPYDFYLMAKVGRGSQLTLESEDHVEVLQKVNRYFASTDGDQMIKTMPPVSRSLNSVIKMELKRLGVVLGESAAAFVHTCMREKTEVTWEDIRDNTEVLPSDEMGRMKKYVNFPPKKRLAMALELFQPLPRRSSVCSSPVTVHNTLEEMKNINYDYYIEETKKLVEPMV